MTAVDRTRYPGYKAYVQGVIGAFAMDDRILGWDVRNETDNGVDQHKGQEDKEPLVRCWRRCSTGRATPIRRSR